MVVLWFLLATRHHPPKSLSNAATEPVVLALVVGLLAAQLGKKIFDQVWGWIDEEEPPEATTHRTTWPKLLLAAAVQGVIFRVTRVAVARIGAQGFANLTGVWPGEEEPEKE